jgi:ribosomal-protein-alanine N-acetyltransferase
VAGPGAATTTVDPWVLGFTLIDRSTGGVIGTCGFKGPPDGDGMVEIAYGVTPGQQNRGFATEAAAALVTFAFSSRDVRIVRAHTMAGESASTRVLAKCGFQPVGQVVDPEDGLVWRWETGEKDGR